ncbi:eukaryotic translation initiation factor 3 subunit G-like [Hetaerina americana]|uniref:eukaryotic translation initiation factor 3 subunit G-like n=1 Tax=Hetaerina americana TaxID=62018 RepID=UPI003A7F273A
MPTETENKSWADYVDDDAGVLPSPTEVISKGIKTVTEYKYDEDEKKTKKYVRTFKIEKRIVSKTIAERKTWAKFGASKHDKPGPNPANTIVSEDVFMQFVTNKEEQDKQDEDPLDKLKSMDQGMVKCRFCKGDHWTTKCPYKESASGMLPDEKGPGASLSTEDKSAKGSSTGKYLPPNMRDGANKRRDGGPMKPEEYSNAAIRVSNLSENTQDADLEELVKPFGQISKMHLGKDRASGLCKGYAYVHYKNKEDAAKAIAQLSGHGYDHLILSVEWSKPQTQ